MLRSAESSLAPSFEKGGPAHVSMFENHTETLPPTRIRLDMVHHIRFFRKPHGNDVQDRMALASDSNGPASITPPLVSLRSD